LNKKVSASLFTLDNHRFIISYHIMLLEKIHIYMIQKLEAVHQEKWCRMKKLEKYPVEL